jgi:glycosyltransferase involved in cell wall biosynthesis
LTEFARHADRARFELRFIALGARGRVADEIEACGWKVTALGAGPGVRPTIAFRLAQLFREEQIDLVHTHNTKPLLYAGPAARLARVGGVVHTRHGQRYGATRRQDSMFRLASRCADVVVCVSENSTRLCHGDGVGAGWIQTIWNGVDEERFAFTKPKAGGPVVYVGRLSYEKDVATLLRAAAIAASASSRSPWGYSATVSP